MLPFLIFSLLACKPTCKQVCDKLVECENPGTERMPSAECEDSCRTQSSLYEDEWTDVSLREAFDAELACIDDAECEDIAAGVCYSEEVWSY